MLSRDQSVPRLDDLAMSVVAGLGVRVPVDAFDLALGLGLRARAIDGTGCLMGRTIFYPRDALRERQHGVVCHEIAHHLLDQQRLPNTERNADYLGAALLVPSAPFSEDLLEVGPDLVALKQRHPNASWSLLGRRIVEFTGGSVSMWREGELVWRRLSAPRRGFGALWREPIVFREAGAVAQTVALDRGYAIVLEPV